MMMFENTAAPAASFLYNGERILLVPDTMEETSAGVYEKTLPDGFTAILSQAQVRENACTRRLRFVHRGKENSGVLSEIRAFDAAEDVDGAVIWESLTGDNCGADSFQPIQRILQPGDRFRVEPRFGRPSDTDGFPFFDLSFGASAATFGIGWSGQWALELERTRTQVRLSVGIAEVETFLYPGEAVSAPVVLWVTGQDIPAARLAFRRVMFSDFSPHTQNGEKVELPVALSCFDRYFGKNEYWNTEEGQKQCADIASRCHMDTLWLDAAWFSVGFPGGVGNYSFAPGYPRGLGPVADRAHANGLRFLVWFEPERVNCYSETYHEHPEDVIVLDSRNSVNCLYNIGDPAARRRLTERLKSHICGDRLDIYRQDFNMCPSGYWRTADVPGRKGMTQIRFVEGHYAMWDALLEAFPGLLIDNCASGGRRLDLETCRRSVPLWRSDTGCSPVTDTHRGHTWSQNQILALTRYLPYHTCGTWSAEPYDVRSTASGGVACDLDVLHPDFQPEAVIPQMEEVKRLRSYWYGDFYPLTQPDNAETVWAAWQLSLGCSGVVYAFRRDACAQETCSLRLTALEKEATYRVTVTDEKMKKTQCVLSGAALETFTVSCPQPRSSVVVEYEKQV